MAKRISLPSLQPAPNPLPAYVPTVATVQARRQEASDIFTLELASQQPLRPFLPGQFNMLYVHGVGEAAISISGAPSTTGQIVHTIRAVGSVTRALAKLRTRDQLGIRGPYGNGWPLAAARGQDLLLVSGGIGLAPLRPVLYDILARREEFGRVILLHGIRSPADHLFADELADWSRRGDLGIQFAAAEADSTWTGQVGMVTVMFARLRLASTRTVAFMCGPEIMMRFVLRELEGRGMARERLFVSMERNMQCAVGFCGHCQFGPGFVCMDGPVFRYDRIQKFFEIREA